MKKILLIVTIAMLGATTGYSQAPGIFNYQGVARNSVGNVLINQTITLRLTIHDGTASGATVYQESRTVATNPLGLFNVQVGSPGASAVTGTIPAVGWGAGNKFLQVEIDPAGGTTFINLGTAQLAAVPYALFANSVADLVLPFNKTQTDAGSLFKVTNSGTATGSTALEGLTNSTAGNANAILGTVTSTSPGGFSAGVRGVNNGTGGLGIGVYGSQAGGGWGVFGIAPTGIGVNGSSGSGSGVNGSSTSGNGVTGTSQSGTGGSFTSATGLALNTSGALRLTGISEGLNKVLTSDAAGNATWQSASGAGIVSGSGTINRVPKWTPTGTALGDSRIEDRAGTRAIGINVPAGYTYISTQSGLEITTSTALDQSRILLRDQSDGGDVQGYVDARTSPATGISGVQLGSFTNHPISFLTNDQFRARLSAAGNFGIGTTAGVDPTSRLQVEGNGASTIVVPSFINFSPANYTKNTSPATDNKVAVLGFSDGVTGASGQSFGITGIAFGNGFSNRGVTGIAGPNSAGYSIGVLGEITETGPNAYAGYFIGKIAVTDGTQGAGKVLTSDAAGSASWQDLITPDVHLSAESITANTTITSGSFTSLINWGDLDEGGGANWNPATGEYTISVAGIYSIFINVDWTSQVAPAGTPANANSAAAINVNGNAVSFGNTGPIIAGSYISSSQAHIEKRLAVGDKISFQAFQATGSPMIVGSGTRFTKFGLHLLHK